MIVDSLREGNGKGFGRRFLAFVGLISSIGERGLYDDPVSKSAWLAFALISIERLFKNLTCAFC